MGYNVMGQRISMEDITGESSYTYDALGRLKTAANGSGKTVEYFYDEADNLQKILYPDGYAVVYTYDKNDNITKIVDRDGRETFYSYDPLNRLTRVKRADGSTSTYTYSARDQIVEAENLCSCGFLISDYQYMYNDAGLITNETAKECLFASNKDFGHKGARMESASMFLITRGRTRIRSGRRQSGHSGTMITASSSSAKKIRECSTRLPIRMSMTASETGQWQRSRKHLRMQTRIRRRIPTMRITRW